MKNNHCHPKYIAKTDIISPGHRKNSGFTLIEILIAIAAGTILVLGLYGVYVFTSKLHRKNIDQQELTQNGRIALERMSRDIRQAQAIVTDLPLTNDDILNPPPSTIQFEDGHDVSKIQYIKYYLSDTNLKRQVIHYYFSASPTIWVKYNARDAFNNLPIESIDEDVIKADKISALQFYGDSFINISLTATNSENNFIFTTEVSGRNI